MPSTTLSAAHFPAAAYLAPSHWITLASAAATCKATSAPHRRRLKDRLGGSVREGGEAMVRRSVGVIFGVLSALCLAACGDRVDAVSNLGAAPEPPLSFHGTIHSGSVPLSGA